ncbi:MAG: hypothetical protein ACHRHE_13895 [Tepidisphaerales bacterium]
MNRKTGQWLTWIVKTGICIVALILILFLLLMTPGQSYERRNRVECAARLRQIGQAMALYDNNHRCWPRTRYDPAKPLGDGFTGGGSADPFAVDGPSANDPTAAMFLLVKRIDLNQEVFVCPSSNQEKDAFVVGNVAYTARERSNFTRQTNLSYSFANMYPDTAAVGRGYKWDPKVPATFVIAADRNDGDTTTTLWLTSNSPTNATRVMNSRVMNSRNHEQDGQNMLYADGHVDWSETPWAGIKKDNIYTSAKVDAAGNQLSPAASAPPWPAPQGPTDTVLVPRKGNGF